LKVENGKLKIKKREGMPVSPKLAGRRFGQNRHSQDLTIKKDFLCGFVA